MIAYLVSKIEALIHEARDTYGVDPVVFLVIYLVCTPIFYYSLFRTLRALAKKLPKEILFWGTVFLCTNLATFVYVLLFGRNIPWWVYSIIAILIGRVIYSLVQKLRRGSAVEAKE